MQAGSFGLVAAFLLILGLAIALSVTIAAPIFAVPFFIVGFGVFLLWRGKRRAEPALRSRQGPRVPRSEETAADPAGDSGLADAARSRSDARTRHEAA